MQLFLKGSAFAEYVHYTGHALYPCVIALCHNPFVVILVLILDCPS